MSAYASDAVRALAEALQNCFNNNSTAGSQNSNNKCRGTELNWNNTFEGNTVNLKNCSDPLQYFTHDL